MNVLDVMTREPSAVRMVDRLDQVARILWEQDCGFVPVVDAANELVGVVTDRDLCMASYTQNKPVANVPVLGAMAREVAVCHPDDSLTSAMELMAKVQVHRLPVVDVRGVLVGVLSSNDLLQLAARHPEVLSATDALATLAAISQPRSGVREFAVPAAQKVAPKKAAPKKAAPKKAAAKKAAKKAPAKKAAKKAPAKKAAKKAAKRTGRKA